MNAYFKATLKECFARLLMVESQTASLEVDGATGS